MPHGHLSTTMSHSSAKSDTASAGVEEQTKAHDTLEATEKTEEAPKQDAVAEESLIVTWDGPDDPENPFNFSLRYKCWITAITSMMTFSVSFGSSIWSAATEATAKEFHVGNVVTLLGITVYVLGFATGRSSLHQALLDNTAAVGRVCVD